MLIITCKDLEAIRKDIEALGYKLPCCCLSCHEDEDEYGYNLPAFWHRDVEFEVCCAKANFLEELPEKVIEEIIRLAGIA